MTKLKPILFSTEMVQAILEGRKTQTRRMVKFPADFTGEVFDNAPYGLKYSSSFYEGTIQRLAYALPDDVFWVRESFIKINDNNFEYKAGFTDEPIKWKPSLFMPKKACRILLKVKSCRVERLIDISFEDCKKEGVMYEGSTDENVDDILALEAYMALWEKINGKDSWIKNPWVWVIEFERVDGVAG